MLDETDEALIGINTFNSGETFFATTGYPIFDKKIIISTHFKK